MFERGETFRLVRKDDFHPGGKLQPPSWGFFNSRHAETWLKDKKHAPWKMNMELAAHPFGKENDLPNLHDYVPCLSSGVCLVHDHWLGWIFVQAVIFGS